MSNFYKKCIPARRLKIADPKKIWWEDTMTSGRIMDLYDKLSFDLNSFITYDRGTGLLELLAEENVTEKELKEVASISPAGRHFTMLMAVATWEDFDRNPEASLEVLRKLIDANPKTIFARGWRGGSIPLHTALSKNAPHAVIELLLSYDPTRSSLLMKGSDGDLPLHKGLKHVLTGNGRTSDGRTRSVRARNATFKLLLSGTNKKKILDAKNNAGKTSIRLACDHFPAALPMLAEERIQLIPAGIPSWHESLRYLVHRYQELDRSLRRNNRFRRDQFTNFFMRLFYKTIANIGTLVKQKPQEITLLQLAVWKGRGFDIDNSKNNSKEERQARWITCGAHHIAHWVADFLGPDPVPRLQAEYDRLIQINDGDVIVFDDSDDEGVVIPAVPSQINNGDVIVLDSDDEN